MFTKVYKTVGDLQLTVDVHIPSGFGGDTGVVLLHFHGGFLVSRLAQGDTSRTEISPHFQVPVVFGEKTTFPPYWLINACHRRGWAYATPSYRLMPENSAEDIVQDAVDASIWARENVVPLGKLILAGSSAGGYLALATVAHPRSPPIAAFLSIYGLLDPVMPRYVCPGQPLGTAVKGLQRVVDEITDSRGQASIDGYPFPATPDTDKRYTWMKAIHEAAIYPDIMTDTPGLSRQICSRGTQTIPEGLRPLFPATFGLRHDWPPSVLVHGDSDVSVALEQSSRLSKDLQNLGINVLLEVVEGQGHGFDVRGIPADVNINDGNGKAFYPQLANAVSFIENTLQSP